MSTPLAESLRPQNLDDFIGQEKLVGTKENPGTIRSLIENKEIPSMIFWGPPASGKTTLAKIISNLVEADFFQLSAVLDGKDKLKKLMKTHFLSKKLFYFWMKFIAGIKPSKIHYFQKLSQEKLF
jgi:putative ATPase